MEDRWNRAQLEEIKFHRRLPTHFPRKRRRVKPSYFLNHRFALPLDFFKGKTVVEIGCASACSVPGIVDAQYKIGIDPLANVFASTYPLGAHYIRSVGENMPFRTGSLDVIVCLNTLDHTKLPYMVLEEVKRCLRENGVVLLQVNAFAALKCIITRLHFLDASHPHHFGDNEVTSAFEHLGFNISKRWVERYGFSYVKGYLRSVGILSTLEVLASLLFGIRGLWLMCRKTRV